MTFPEALAAIVGEESAEEILRLLHAETQWTLKSRETTDTEDTLHYVKETRYVSDWKATK